jgi:hypothetical protein
MIKQEIMLIQYILLQIPPHIHPVWDNPFFYLFMASSIVLFTFAIATMRVIKRKTADMKLIQQQHVAKIDLIRDDHAKTLEKIRVEMLKKEEERGRQWMESEKETLHVLNGVSILLDLNEKIGRVESEKILLKLDEIREKIEKITSKE